MPCEPPLSPCAAAPGPCPALPPPSASRPPIVWQRLPLVEASLTRARSIPPGRSWPGPALAARARPPQRALEAFPGRRRAARSRCFSPPPAAPCQPQHSRSRSAPWQAHAGSFRCSPASPGASCLSLQVASPFQGSGPRCGPPCSAAGCQPPTAQSGAAAVALPWELQLGPRAEARVLDLLVELQLARRQQDCQLSRETALLQ
mmetsp:Transcript_47710/g.103799  ORF Transcript_47710/g.103799 Transcript_47710/m.103799 type:complete len:203 (+) Transcript_47710:718-1326(+)